MAVTTCTCTNPLMFMHCEVVRMWCQSTEVFNSIQISKPVCNSRLMHMHACMIVEEYIITCSHVLPHNMYIRFAPHGFHMFTCRLSCRARMYDCILQSTQRCCFVISSGNIYVIYIARFRVTLSSLCPLKALVVHHGGAVNYTSCKPEYLGPLFYTS